MDEKVVSASSFTFVVYDQIQNFYLFVSWSRNKCSSSQKLRKVLNKGRQITGFKNDLIML